jgi:Coenzyme PQQ synthesis protein D (PqqD)
MSDRAEEQYAPARGAQVFTVVLDGDAVLLDESADRLHLLNHTGALLWQLYDGSTSLGMLADEVAAELGLDRARVVDDIVSITAQLANEGLIA